MDTSAFVQRSSGRSSGSWPRTTAVALGPTRASPSSLRRAPPRARSSLRSSPAPWGGPRRDEEGRAPQAQGVRPRRGGEGPRHDVRRRSVRRRQLDAGSPGLVSAVEPVCGAVVDVHFASSTLASEQRLADGCRPRRKLASAIRLRRMPRQGASIRSERRRIEAVRSMSRIAWWPTLERCRRAPPLRAHAVRDAGPLRRTPSGLRRDERGREENSECREDCPTLLIGLRGPIASSHPNHVEVRHH